MRLIIITFFLVNLLNLNAQYVGNHTRFELSDSIIIINKGVPFWYIPTDSCCYYSNSDTLKFKNGAIKAFGTFSKEKKADCWTSFYSNGKPRSKGMIKDGKLFDKWTFYYDNGNKRAEGKFEFENIPHRDNE